MSEMKIQSAHTYSCLTIITDEDGHNTYRKNIDGGGWERLMGDRWEVYSGEALDEILMAAYSEYLNLPKATISGGWENWGIYRNNWCVITDRSFYEPYPHRHFTFKEFLHHCGVDEEFFKYFLGK